jgi:acetyltransferase
VAIIGASQDPTKRGHQAVRALQDAGYGGDIHLVHPDGGELLGLPVSPSIGELSAVPDLALICTSSARVPDVVRACAAHGIHGAIVLAVGFREAGDRGRALEDEVLSAAAASGLRLIGPNTSGVLNPALGLNLVGSPPPRAGSLAVLSQSGNVGLDVMTQLRDRELGLSLYVGVGNEGDVRFDEYLEFLERDEATRAILIYAEGLSDPKAFFATAERVNRTKPIVVLKGGRSDRGNSAALSHTGAIAGSYDVFEALLRQRGITITTRSDQVLDLALALGGQPPGGHGLQHGVAVIADGGGHATLAVDRLAELGMGLAEFSPEGQERLRELLGPAAAVGNPVDLAGAGDRNMSVFPECMDVVAAESAVGSVLLTGLFGGYTIRFDDSLDQEETEAAVRISRIAAEAGVPVLVHTLYAAHKTAALRRLRRAGVPVLASLDTAGRCIQALFARGEYLAAHQETDGRRPPDPEAPGPVPAAEAGVEASLIVEQARREGRVALNEAEGRRIVAEAGVRLVPGDFCMSPSKAVAAAGSFEGPAVAKLISSTILHRSEAGGVTLGLRTSAEVEDAFERIRASADAFAREARIEADFRGVLICEQLAEPIAELLVGCRRDPQYGPILVVGAGGVSAEVWPDRSIRGLPVAANEVREMLAELRIFPILRGYRGGTPVDFESLTSLIQSLAVYFLANRELAEVELNPVFTGPDEATTVDVLAFATNL